MYFLRTMYYGMSGKRTKLRWVYLQNGGGNVPQIIFGTQRTDNYNVNRNYIQLIEKHLSSNFVRCFFMGIFVGKKQILIK